MVQDAFYRVLIATPRLDPSSFSKNLEREFQQVDSTFLGFENLVKPFNKKDVLSAITVSAKSHDVVVVSMHWGEEYQPEPDLLTVELAREMIDAGADIIFGHHPHVLQPVERYKDGLIFYSLGNFIFDQFGEAQNTSMIATVDVFEDGELDYSTTPVLIDEGFPVLK